MSRGSGPGRSRWQAQARPLHTLTDVPQVGPLSRGLSQACAPHPFPHGSLLAVGPPPGRWAASRLGPPEPLDRAADPRGTPF